jgi:hypothetical protein
MQIEEVGVGVCNTARKNRRVGETFRYFTIILPPIVVDAAKSEKRPGRKEEERGRGLGYGSRYFDT